MTIKINSCSECPYCQREDYDSDYSCTAPGTDYTIGTERGVTPNNSCPLREGSIILRLNK
jgi:hypothetical protein